MAELQVNLPDSVRDYAGAQVATGRFASIDDYLGALVSADERFQRTLAALNEQPRLVKLLEEGLASGEGRRWSAAVLNELKQQVLDQNVGPHP